MNKKKLTIIIIIASIVTTLTLAVAIPFTILGIRTASLKSDYQYLKDEPEYSLKVETNNIELVAQHISCGYATIEMMSSYYGNKVTEDDLSKKNGGSISTSTTSGFLNEINRTIKDKTFVQRTYLKHDILLKEIHTALRNDNPVAIEWAAQTEGQWTLHFSIVSGLDLKNDNVTVYNPYGYVENIKVDEFIDRTSFNAYKNIPFFLDFGFAFGAFDKNAIFYAK